MLNIIDKHAVEIRKEWINKIAKSNGKFSDDFSVLENELADEINKLGTKTLLDHLRLCGNIP